jgi:uncharacterized protein
MITTDLLRDIKDQFLIDWSGIHGISHWARVYDIGMKLAVLTGANTRVVQLFSIFHDSGRQTDGSDPKHGLRGARLAERVRETHLRTLSGEDFDLLHTACCLHTSAPSHDNVTIRTCFDADRLDLGRVGTIPDPKYLCTDAAKSEGLISWALENCRSGKVPDNILGTW